jgi:hypothetical protein
MFPSDVTRTWRAFVDTLLTVARNCLPPEYTVQLMDWIGGAICPPPGGEEVLIGYFGISSHRLAMNSCDRVYMYFF